jgi:hypothetical protein
MHWQLAAAYVCNAACWLPATAIEHTARCTAMHVRGIQKPYTAVLSHPSATAAGLCYVACEWLSAAVLLLRAARTRAHLRRCQSADGRKQHHIARVQPKLLRGAGPVLLHCCAIGVELHNLMRDATHKSDAAHKRDRHVLEWTREAHSDIVGCYRLDADHHATVMPGALMLQLTPLLRPLTEL